MAGKKRQVPGGMCDEAKTREERSFHLPVAMPF